MALAVRDPHGTAWRVRRRWSARRVRVRGGRDMIDVPDLSLGDVFDDGLSAIVAAVVFVLILFFVLVPVAALLVEVLLVVIFVAGYVAGRVVLRRPWDIEATAGGRTHRVRAKGWRASRAAMRELAEAIQRGEPPARPLSAPVPSAGSEPR